MMFNLVEKRRWYFIFSGILALVGVGIMIFSTIQTGSPFRLSIAFVGGSIYEFQFVEEGATEANIREVFAQNGLDNVVIQRLGGNDESFYVVGDVDVDALETAIGSGEVTIQTLNETIYTFSFDDVVPELEIVQETLGAGVFVIQRRDGEWSAIVSTSDVDQLARNLETLNEQFPLTFNAHTGQTLGVNIDGIVISEQALISALDEANLNVSFVQRRPYRWSVRGGSFAEQAISDSIMNGLGEIANIDESSLRISTVSETVGREVTRAALLAIGMACIVVIGFIAVAFRSVPNAFRYGVCAVVAMLHDVMVVAMAMSLMGLLAGWEVDALFLTAVLTIVGFSVQDTIVMFDRIRENIPKHLGEPYEMIINRSVWETLHRSLGTQLSTFFVIIAILLFGGETIRQFIAILFIGLLSGAYSSLFTAVPLLVAWEKGEIPFIKSNQAPAS
jgi:preprotein translocase SecF subunit